MAQLTELPLYCTNLSNIQYLTGFTGTSGVCLLKPEETILFTDGRYLERATKEVFSHIVVKDIKKYLKDEMQSLNICFVEAESIILSEFDRLNKEFSSVKFIKGASEVEHLRATKTKEEIEIITRCSDIAIRSLNRVIANELRYGMEEKELAFLLAKEMVINQGADDVSFDIVVAFGDNTSEPHHKTSNSKLKTGDMLWIDFGAKYRGYCSDITRAFFTNTPLPDQMRIYNLVLSYLRNFSKLYINKKSCTSIHAEMMEVCKKDGVEDLVRHFIGHGIGLQIHEQPRISDYSMDILRNGMVVSCEPGLYVYGKFGVRLEDMIIINDKDPIILTQSLDKRLQVLSLK